MYHYFISYCKVSVTTVFFYCKFNKIIITIYLLENKTKLLIKEINFCNVSLKLYMFLHYYAVILLIAYPFRDQASPYQQISLYRSVINFIFNMCEIMHASWKRNSRVASELQAVRTSFNLTMVYAKKKSSCRKIFHVSLYFCYPLL